MEAALKDAVYQIQAAIDFLDKIKLDKKFRKDKDDLVANLNRTLQKSKQFTSQNQIPNGNAKGEELYNDVEAAQSGEVYNDVSVADAEDTYVDNEVMDAPDVYTDTDAMPVTSDEQMQSPSSTQAAPVFPSIPCDQLTGATLGEFLQVKRERTILTGGWSKRWCVLHHNALYVYESSKDKKQKDAIDLRGFVFEVREEITREAKRRDRCFELRNDNQKKTYDFCATDRDGFLRWKSALLNTGVVRKGSIVTADTVSMKSDTTDTDAHSKTKSLFAGLKNKLVGGSASSQAELPASAFQDDTYNDTEDAPPLHGANGSELYADTENPNEDLYDDTETKEEIYDDADTSDVAQLKPAAALDKRPLPSPGVSPSKSLPPPPINLTSLPPTPPPGIKSNPGRSSTKESPMLPPRTPQGHRPQLPPSPIPTMKPVPNVLESDANNAKSPGEDEEDYENMYQGMWDCSADDDTELEFKRGEIVHVISREYESFGWWIAKKNEVVGLVPKSYLMEAYEI